MLRWLCIVNVQQRQNKCIGKNKKKTGHKKEPMLVCKKEYCAGIDMGCIRMRTAVWSKCRLLNVAGTSRRGWHEMTWWKRTSRHAPPRGLTEELKKRTEMSGDVRFSKPTHPHHYHHVYLSKTEIYSPPSASFSSSSYRSTPPPLQLSPNCHIISNQHQYQFHPQGLFFTTLTLSPSTHASHRFICPPTFPPPTTTTTPAVYPTWIISLSLLSFRSTPIIITILSICLPPIRHILMFISLSSSSHTPSVIHPFKSTWFL